MGSIIAVVGDGRGVGTTTVVSLVGSALSEQLRQAALIDGAREGTRLGGLYGLEPENTLVEMLRRGRQPVDVRTSGPHGSDLFLGTDDASWDAVPPTSIRGYYEHLRDRVDIALVDLGGMGDPSAVPWLGYADEFVVVTDSGGPNHVDEFTAIGDTFDVDFRGVIVNGVDSKQLDSVATDWAGQPHSLLSVLPRDEVAGASARADTSIILHDPDSELSTIGWRLAESLADTEDHDPILPESVSIDTSDSRQVSADLDPDDMVTEQSAPKRTAGQDELAESQTQQPPESPDSPSVSAASSLNQPSEELESSDSLSDHVDRLTEIGEGAEEFEDSAGVGMGDSLGGWQDMDVDETDSDDETNPSSEGLSDWREDNSEDDGLQGFGSSNSGGGLDWGSSESESSRDDEEMESEESATESADDPDDEIEAAFQEAMEQAKDKQFGDDEPSIEDLLE